MNADALWSKACKHLQELLHPDVYSRWIAVIKAKELSDSALTLSVDNDFYQTWLEENYLPLIENAVSSVCGAKLRIEFVVTHTPVQPAEETPPKSSLRDRFLRRPKSELPLNPKFTFENFVVGPSNSFAHAASLAVAQAPARAYNPLFIYGGVGLGKTHLMQAIGHHVLSHSKSNVCYLSCEAFTNEYIEALQNRSLVQFRKKYRTTHVLLIDDIHFLAGKERLQEEFFHTFNVLFDAHKQIVMTSDRPANEIVGLEQRLVSRFEWGLVTELHGPDLETRIAILRNKMSQMNGTLPDEVVQFIAEHIKANVRRLEGALIRCMSYRSLTHQDLTVETLEKLLRDTLEQEKREILTFDAIQRTVADYYDIRLADMTSKRRHQAVALPRQIAMYLCRTMTQASLPEIGEAFAKTHATILHACRHIETKMKIDNTFRETVTQLSQRLQKQTVAR
ncbi:MAG: chromosomal replication initiator protein DnaA [Kiritimatiellae bacterium]|nr:chromosomal replication initiator protein DnaA [Kiritimatiellia bacterium]